MQKLNLYAVAIAALLTTSLSVQGQTTLPSAGPAVEENNAAAVADTPREDFISETRVYFPEAVGKFYLDESKGDGVNGASLRYGYEGATFAVDVFVYPVGRMSEAEALDTGMKDLLLSFEQAQQLGYYQDVDLDRPRDFTVRLSPFVQLPGRQVSYTAIRNGAPVVSHSLLVYRSYHMIKTRITAPKDEKSGAKRVAQHVVEELLPALRLAHVGGCAQNNAINYTFTRTLPPKGDRISPDGSQAFVRERDKDNPLALAEALVRKADSACFANFDEQKIEPGEKFETLTYPAGIWREHDGETETSAPAR